VNSFGRASSVSQGTANITATFPKLGGQSGKGVLTVSTALLQSIAVNPPTTLLAPGSSLHFEAVGTYDSGPKQYLIATWSTSDNTIVSIIPNSGVATGQLPGSATITATYTQPNQLPTSGTAGVVVEQFPLVSIAVAPLAGSVPFGVSIPFTATGTFGDNSTQNLTSNVTWASGQSSVATISNAPGKQGVATGVATGQTAITAVFAGIVGNATLNVTNATITSIAVTTPTPSVTAGTPVVFTAKGTFSDSSVVDLTSQVAWSSSDATVVTINSIGQANTVKAGTAVITATFTQDGTTVNGQFTLTVN
jgi:hypothetical protein